MTEQEQADLEILKSHIRTNKENWYSMCQSINRATDRELETMGFKGKSKGDAMLGMFQLYEKNIKNLTNAHIKKYPDD